jgi:YEATS domain-containing protein 4
LTFYSQVFGSIAKPIPASSRPSNLPPDHTHRWTIFVQPISSNHDITHWLKKVQFKLHETYSQSLRTVEAPPFEVTETGWGEFEVAIKLFFVPEAGEKPISVYHQLKLHPYGPDMEKQKEKGGEVISRSYEEIVFNEPSEVFYEILTSGHDGQGMRGKGKSAKSASGRKGERTAEIPYVGSENYPYSLKLEGQELDRLKEAVKQVEVMVVEERKKLNEREALLGTLRKEAAETKS